MNSPNVMALAVTLVGLASFMLASGFLVLGFKPTSASRNGGRIGYAFFIIGTLTATLHATAHGATSILLAAAVSWATVISWFVWKIEQVGAFTAPIIAVILMANVFFTQNAGSIVATNTETSMRVHIISAVLGQSCAILACGLSLLFLWLDKKLKRRQLSELPLKFPAINTLNSALTATLWVGFIFITVSLLTGAMYDLMGLISPEANLIPKITWAILVWVWYLAILVLQGLQGYRPQKVARMSLVGFFILALSWFGLIFWAPWGHA